VPEEVGGVSYFTRERLLEAVDYLVSHAYVMFETRVFRQTCGVPMGGHESPPLADITLAYYEWTFMEYWEGRDVRVARAFAHTMRYLDDVLCPANPLFDQMMFFNRTPGAGGLAVPPTLVFPGGETLDLADVPSRHWGMYPGGMLALSETTHDRDASRVHYLDLDVAVVPKDGAAGMVLRVDIWDKRVDLHIPIIRYPDARSMLALECGTGILLSQAYRFAERLGSVTLWARHMAEVAVRLAGRGYTWSALRRQLRTVYARFATRFGVRAKSLGERVERAIAAMGGASA
jgi:hypothetical protein